MRTVVAVGIGLAALVVGGGVALAATSSKPAAPAAPLASSYSAAHAIPVGLGGSITIPLGSSLMVDAPPGGLWQGVVTSSNAAVMANSQPTTTSGFVAVALGTATLSGTYQDSGGAPFTGTVLVTVIAAGAGAIASGGSTSLNATLPPSSGGSSLPAAVTASLSTPAGSLPPGSPDGLVASSATPSGWQVAVSILANRAGMIYQGFQGDVIRVSLPPGAHWRQSVSSIGPRSGTDDFVFTLTTPITLILAYTDAASLDTGTTITFEIGGVFQRTAHLTTGDYLILAVASADVAQVGASFAAWQASPSTATSDQQREVIALAAALAGAQSTGATFNLVQAFAMLALVGPWATAFGVDVRYWALYQSGDTLPPWWPADDTAAGGEIHFFYRYIGRGIDVASLPFPVTAWKRVA
jgi:hypothetical protein